MRKDTSFSERKLTRQEFSDKYWNGGKAPYQYHTAEIEDGRDEREQFIINNVRALWDAAAWYWRHPVRAAKKAIAPAVTGMIAGLLALAISIAAYLR